MRSLRRLKSLYLFCRSPANTWDVHELTVAKHGKQLLDRLTDMRLQHDHANQARTLTHTRDYPGQPVPGR